MSRAYDDLAEWFNDGSSNEDDIGDVVRRLGGEILTTPEQEWWPAVGRVQVRARVDGGAVAIDEKGRVWIREDPKGS
ncbi:MAG TPA: hypothetical protein VMX54_10035 [Vicinamibacteria bacterium]|nr:hypothetical protein [Vicinamibacteria bacterium]